MLGRANLLFLGLWGTLTCTTTPETESLPNLTSKQECGTYAMKSHMFLGLVTVISTVVGMADGKFLVPYSNLKQIDLLIIFL